MVYTPTRQSDAGSGIGSNTTLVKTILRVKTRSDLALVSRIFAILAKKWSDFNRYGRILYQKSDYRGKSTEMCSL